MSKDNSIFQRLIAGIVLIALGASVQSGTIAGTGGSTEITQILNNSELVAGVYKQAEMVAEQVQSKLVQLDQLTSMQTNLEKLRSGDVASVINQFRSQVRAYQDLKNATTGLRDAAASARAMFEARGIDFSGSGRTDLRSYIQYELELAKRKGGVYRQRLDQDLGALDNMQQRSQEFRRVADETANITGNVQGIQRLSQLSAMTAGELMELKAAVLAQNAESNRQQIDAVANTEVKSGVHDQTVRGARERKNRDNSATSSRIDPLKPWGNLGGNGY
ncbi:hypothetical protein [Limnohabitans sp. T6-5]|uniref:hypothetical protein n=1 Tax=Limnohabitans sp. T6-5 TaxID=1100724 RepID=UPI0011B23E3B|nr:hypothetical protein [Limnohabitans sp. T6-5]